MEITMKSNKTCQCFLVDGASAERFALRVDTCMCMCVCASEFNRQQKKENTFK